MEVIKRLETLISKHKEKLDLDALSKKCTEKDLKEAAKIVLVPYHVPRVDHAYSICANCFIVHDDCHHYILYRVHLVRKLPDKKYITPVCAPFCPPCRKGLILLMIAPADTPLRATKFPTTCWYRPNASELEAFKIE